MEEERPQTRASCYKGEEEDGQVILARIRRDSDDSNVETARLRLRLRPRQTTGLQILLTREDDPSFFYFVDITEADFRELRSRQGLIVDLSAFPTMITRLLDTCLTEAAASDQPKFFAVLDYVYSSHDEVNLDVQEINAYRRLAHLSLKLRKGTDAKVRQHLSECLSSLKADHKTLQVNLDEARLELRNVQETNAGLIAQMEVLKKEFLDKDTSYQSRLSKEVTEEREKAAKVVAEMRVSYEAERRRLCQEQTVTVRQLENRAAALDYDNRDLTEKKHKYEASLQMMREENKSIQEQLRRLKVDLDKHQKENSNLGHGNTELDRHVSKLQARVDVLEQEKARLNQDLQRRDEQMQEVGGQKKSLEQDLAEKKALVAKREVAIKSVSQELLKANDVIKKLQEQNRKENHKIRLGYQIVQEQEKVLGDKDTELESVRRQLKEKGDECNACLEEKHWLENLVETQKKTVEELSKKSKTEEAVIQWLNKQLTTAQARDPGLRLGPPPTGIQFTPSAMASTSTPVQKENHVQTEHNSPSTGLDPKYLQPSPLLATSRNSQQQSRMSRNAAAKGGGSGLLRKNFSPTTTDQLRAQSVYFSKT